MNGELPDRLWLGCGDDDGEHAVWFDPDEGGTEYVRALTPAPSEVRENFANLESVAHTLRSRLRSRSRSEYFQPGSIAPELLRRSEELLDMLLVQADAILSSLQGEAQPVAWLRQFGPDVENVQSRFILVHQLRASADIQSAEVTKRMGRAATTDRATMMREAADAIEQLAAHPSPEQAGEVERLRGALDRARKFIDACAVEGELTPNDAAENPCELVLAIDAALNPGAKDV